MNSEHSHLPLEETNCGRWMIHIPEAYTQSQQPEKGGLQTKRMINKYV